MFDWADLSGWFKATSPVNISSIEYDQLYRSITLAVAVIMRESLPVKNA